jgi:hypothetical protein
VSYELSPYSQGIESENLSSVSFFWVVLGFWTQGLWTCEAGTLPLDPHFQFKRTYLLSPVLRRVWGLQWKMEISKKATVLLNTFTSTDVPQHLVRLCADKCVIHKLKISQVENAFNIPKLLNFLTWQHSWNINCVPLLIMWSNWELWLIVTAWHHTTYH